VYGVTSVFPETLIVKIRFFIYQHFSAHGWRVHTQVTHEGQEPAGKERQANFDNALLDAKLSVEDFITTIRAINALKETIRRYLQGYTFIPSAHLQNERARPCGELA